MNTSSSRKLPVVTLKQQQQNQPEQPNSNPMSNRIINRINITLAAESSKDGSSSRSDLVDDDESNMLKRLTTSSSSTNEDVPTTGTAAAKLPNQHQQQSNATGNSTGSNGLDESLTSLTWLQNFNLLKSSSSSSKSNANSVDSTSIAMSTTSQAANSLTKSEHPVVTQDISSSLSTTTTTPTSISSSLININYPPLSPPLSVQCSPNSTNSSSSSSSLTSSSSPSSSSSSTSSSITKPTTIIITAPSVPAPIINSIVSTPLKTKSTTQRSASGTSTTATTTAKKSKLTSSSTNKKETAAPPVTTTSKIDICYQNDCSAKPPYSYSQLIVLSMRESRASKMTLQMIYDWIIDNFGYFRKADPNWQVTFKNSIRHNLSLNKCFKKIARQKDEPGKGGFWTLDDDYKKQLLSNEAFAFKSSAQHLMSSKANATGTTDANSNSPTSTCDNNGLGGNNTVQGEATMQSLKRKRKSKNECATSIRVPKSTIRKMDEMSAAVAGTGKTKKQKTSALKHSMSEPSSGIDAIVNTPSTPAYLSPFSTTPTAAATSMAMSDASSSSPMSSSLHHNWHQHSHHQQPNHHNQHQQHPSHHQHHSHHNHTCLHPNYACQCSIASSNYHQHHHHHQQQQHQQPHEQQHIDYRYYNTTAAAPQHSHAHSVGYNRSMTCCTSMPLAFGVGHNHYHQAHSNNHHHNHLDDMSAHFASSSFAHEIMKSMDDDVDPTAAGLFNFEQALECNFDLDQLTSSSSSSSSTHHQHTSVTAPQSQAHPSAPSNTQSMLEQSHHLSSHQQQQQHQQQHVRFHESNHLATTSTNASASGTTSSTDAELNELFEYTSQFSRSLSNSQQQQQQQPGPTSSQLSQNQSSSSSTNIVNSNSVSVENSANDYLSYLGTNSYDLLVSSGGCSGDANSQGTASTSSSCAESPLDQTTKSRLDLTIQGHGIKQPKWWIDSVLGSSSNTTSSTTTLGGTNTSNNSSSATAAADNLTTPSFHFIDMAVVDSHSHTTDLLMSKRETTSAVSGVVGAADECDSAAMFINVCYDASVNKSNELLAANKEAIVESKDSF